MQNPIPVIDLFAGPGGLAEGFATARPSAGKAAFRIALSIEKDEIAHQTLTLRSVYRYLRDRECLSDYYAYVRGKLDKSAFFDRPATRNASAHSRFEARCATLGEASTSDVDAWISAALAGSQDWVLIGGPPCQAYSLVGRSRRKHDSSFEDDEKHFLYKEYLRIIRKHVPSVFVMENVKGILSSKHGGTTIFPRIVEDLTHPGKGIEYQLRSFVQPDLGFGQAPGDFVVRAERYGVPQMRHRVIVLGIRSDLAGYDSAVLRPVGEVTVAEALGGLPSLRSNVSGSITDSLAWKSAVLEMMPHLRGWKHESAIEMAANVTGAFSGKVPETTGTPYQKCRAKPRSAQVELASWLYDPKLRGVLQHEARSHMESDLHRYAFAALFTQLVGRSPKLSDFPKGLLPAHKNAADTDAPFADRFRVQAAGKPSTTITSHIAKDGHYYIHPDPLQCRSLTVREAARLQTFPDNYFFEGNRTQQYAQVGNAVPPFLARQLGEVVADFLIRSQKNAQSRHG